MDRVVSPPEPTPEPLPLESEISTEVLTALNARENVVPSN